MATARWLDVIGWWCPVTIKKLVSCSRQVCDTFPPFPKPLRFMKPNSGHRKHSLVLLLLNCISEFSQQTIDDVPVTGHPPYPSTCSTTFRWLHPALSLVLPATFRTFAARKELMITDSLSRSVQHLTNYPSSTIINRPSFSYSVGSGEPSLWPAKKGTLLMNLDCQRGFVTTKHQKHIYTDAFQSC